MARKKCKVGDRVFFELPGGDIETAIVLEVEEQSYINDYGKEIPYLWLTTDKSDNFTMGIEDYNCLSASNPKCKELVAKYKKFDKKKDEIVNSILEIMSPWERAIQSEIIDTLKLKLHI